MRHRILIVALAALVGFGRPRAARSSSPSTSRPPASTRTSSPPSRASHHRGRSTTASRGQRRPAARAGARHRLHRLADGLTYTFTLREGWCSTTAGRSPPTTSCTPTSGIIDVDTGSPVASRFAQVASVDRRRRPDRRVQPVRPLRPVPPEHGVPHDRAARGRRGARQPAAGRGRHRPVHAERGRARHLHAARGQPGLLPPGEPGVAALRYNVVPEASTRAAGLRTGAYHLIPDVDPATAQTLGNVAGVTLLGVQELSYTLIGMNTTRPPFDDPRVRRALNLALDREEIVEAVYFGNAVPGGPLSPALTDWALPVSEYACYAPDAATARELLAEAGYPDGVDFEIVTLGTLRVVVDVRPGGAGAVGRGRLPRDRDRRGGRQLRAALAQRRLRHLRQPQRRQPRPRRLPRPHLPHRRIDERLPVQQPRRRHAADRRAAGHRRSRPARASTPSCSGRSRATVRSPTSPTPRSSRPTATRSTGFVQMPTAACATCATSR
jgi:hypothetical protein